MLVLFTVTIFVSAALLFLVQPMFARMVLPSLGGSPSVWNTALVFYQGILLAGYGYAHFLTTRLRLRQQVMAHLAVLLLPLAVLPIGISASVIPPAEHNPTLWLLRLMLVTIGLPFFAVSASSPILQKWFGTTDHATAKDPYFLYAASNAGSMIALLGYPALAEPFLRLAEQSRWWQGLYGVLVVLFAVCGGVLWRRSRRTEGNERNEEDGLHHELRRERPAEAGTPNLGPSPIGMGAGKRQTVTERKRPTGESDISLARRLRWILLAFIPSSLMQGVTMHLSTELAPVPLLWVIPLAVYLLTFILVFARKPPISPGFIARFLPVATVPVMMAMATRVTQPLLLLILLHLVFLFFAAMACHGALAEDRPAPSHLTEFYFWMSLGGVLGGVFNALLAPVLFQSVLEYPIAVVLTCLCGRSWNWRKLKWQEAWQDLGAALLVGVLAAGLAIGGARVGWVNDTKGLGVVFGIPALVCFFLSQRPLRFALCVAVMLWAARFSPPEKGTLIYTERSFFGVSRVTLDSAGSYRRLFHGNTLHGLQSLDPARRREALTYYYRNGPIGQVFEALPVARALPIAAVGLGAGSIATYGQPGQEFTFYEIDPVVEKIASDPRFFSSLRDSPAKVTTVLGDARLKLAAAPDGHYGLMVLDAYSGDAVPVHLLTREALQLYLRKLVPHGVLAFHISNRHLDLPAVLGPLARDAGLVCWLEDQSETTPEEAALGKTPSTWAIMARNAETLGPLAKWSQWKALIAAANARVWTDDFSSLLSVVEW